MTFRDSNEAFADAIKAGRLSDFRLAANYAGKYMYMGTNEAGEDLFKHIDTRQYLPVAQEVTRG